jgi:hypothetical protein
MSKKAWGHSWALLSIKLRLGLIDSELWVINKDIMVHLNIKMYRVFFFQVLEPSLKSIVNIFNSNMQENKVRSLKWNIIYWLGENFNKYKKLVREKERHRKSSLS